MPYCGLSLSHEDTQRLRLGSRLTRSPSLRLSLEGETAGGREAGHAIEFKLLATS